MKKYFVSLFMSLFYVLLLQAQSVTIKQSFQAIPNSSVLASYKNQFGSWEEGDAFPYAVIRIELEGNAHEVTAAKQLLHLDLGELGYEVSVYKGMQNELLFLVPVAAQQIYLTCGTGCVQQCIITTSKPLQKNTVYLGRVHYVPEKLQTTLATHTDQYIFRQFFRFNLTPADAIVSVEVDGVMEIWSTNNGVAYKMLNYGSYPYLIYAEGYQPQHGTIEVSDESKAMDVILTPLQ
ncbi:MAG: hypothetical protein IKY87_06765 [Paludibacteraceae bacterium]|nr:hypothetical protein [Paludibacteraceae bacterium]